MEKNIILTGISSHKYCLLGHVCWTILLARNDIVSDKVNPILSFASEGGQKYCIGDLSSFGVHSYRDLKKWAKD